MIFSLISGCYYLGGGGSTNKALWEGLRVGCQGWGWSKVDLREEWDEGREVGERNWRRWSRVGSVWKVEEEFK